MTYEEYLELKLAADAAHYAAMQRIAEEQLRLVRACVELVGDSFQKELMEGIEESAPNPPMELRLEVLGDVTKGPITLASERSGGWEIRKIDVLADGCLVATWVREREVLEA